MSEPSASEPTGRPAPPRRRTNSWRVLFFGLAMTGIVAGVGWALLGSKLLVVRSVVVTGTHLVPPATVLAMADLQPGTPMVRVNAAQIQARVDGIRQVQSVQVVKSWPDRVVIEVTERNSAVAVAAPSGGFDLVDPSGVVVRWVASRPWRLPRFLSATPIAALRGDPAVAQAAVVLRELPAALRTSVVSVSVPEGQVTVMLKSGVTVVWGDSSAAGVKAQVLAVLMRTHARYYDVSGPGVAVTKT